ncbi:MAG: FAD-binding oxidoreductase [Pseudomonadota bacterium]
MLLKQTVDTSEHAESYYAATANHPELYPALGGDLHADAVIIGGGFSGVSTAVELCERGYSVVLLEANRISWGASGRNGGQIIGGVGNNPDAFRSQIGSDGVEMVYGMASECVDILRERIARYSIDCDLKWGYCEVALRQRHLKAYRSYAEEDENIQLLDARELRDYVNSDLYLGGYYREDWGHLHPLNLCVGEAKAAESMGARLFENSVVTRIEYGDNPCVYTDTGSVRAGHVIICGNAYMGALVPYLDARVLPATSCIIATQPLSDDQVAATLPRDVAVCDSRTALDYYRLSADRRMLFGGLSNYTGLEPVDVTGTLKAKMNKVFPALKGVRIDYEWSGNIAISMRRMPQLGRLEGNVLYAVGYSGHGVAPTHMMGRVLAEAVDGDTRRLDVMNRMQHWRWPGGKLLRRPAMALGMMYFKLKDVF